MEVIDQQTADYFDAHMPEYAISRLEYALKFITSHCQPNSSLVDIGCGTGNILKYIKDHIPIEHLCGIDISEKYLEKTQENVGCQTLRGSILDNDFAESISSKFDFAILAAVLHHLVGKTRKQSRTNASIAVANALKQLKSGGHLIIWEPVLYPAFLMDVVFYTKRLVTKFTSRRIQILGRVNNIGAPVVSYFTNEQLEGLFAQIPGCRIADKWIKERKPTALMRLAGITRRADNTFILRVDRR